jgi:MFS family permease
MKLVNMKLNYILVLFVVFGGFLIFGFSENIKGPAIPMMQADFHLNEGQLGMLLALNSLGYLVACSFTSALSRRIGIRWTGIAAFASITIAGVLMYASKSYATLSASYFLMYIGNGMLEIGLAIMAARIFVKNTGTMMNLAHFFYGLSSIVAPLIAASMMGWGASGSVLGWRGMYVIILSLAVLPIIPSIWSKFPEDNHEPAERISYGMLLRDPIAWLIVAILSFGVVSELAVGSWLVNFLEKAYGWSTTSASGMLSLFFLFFTFARLFLGPITDRIGYTLSVMIFAALSGLCTIAAILIGDPGAILFAIAGAGIAPIYPTVMAMITKRYPKGTDTAITFTVTLMGVASVIGNLFIGYLIEFVQGLFEGDNMERGRILGLQAGYGFIALMAILCSACCMYLFLLLRRRGELI